jgi:hypothetical protein
MHLLHYLVRQARWVAKISPLVLTIATTPAASDAEQPKSHEAEFRAFYAEFLAAVRANDKNRLVDLIAFPVKDWSVERKGMVETIDIKGKSDFLAKYDSLFTPFMRSHVLGAKPQKLSDDRYMVMWQDANAEFSFQFEYMAPRGYRVTAYGIGPR